MQRHYLLPVHYTLTPFYFLTAGMEEIKLPVLEGLDALAVVSAITPLTMLNFHCR